MDKFTIKHRLYGLQRKIGLFFLIALALILTLSSCSKKNKKSGSVSSQLITSDEFTKWPEEYTDSFDDYEDVYTRTYISMPDSTYEEKLAIINERIQITFDFPMPLKIENFQNTPSALYATALYSAKDFKKLIYDNGYESCMDIEVARIYVPDDSEGKKPAWWMQDEIYTSLIMGYANPTTYVYREKDAQNGEYFIAVTSQTSFVCAYSTDNNDVYRVFFGCETGLPIELESDKKCYDD